jgi:hypothetical protein
VLYNGGQRSRTNSVREFGLRTTRSAALHLTDFNYSEVINFEENGFYLFTEKLTQRPLAL